MPLLVSGCGERECNGIYYQQNHNPPTYIQSNQNHQIILQEQIISQGYGATYKSKTWILQKMNTPNGKPCVLYLSYQNNNSIESPPFSNNVEWKPIAGSSPVPQVRNGMVGNNNNKDDDDAVMQNKSDNNMDQLNGNQATKRNYHFKSNRNNGHTPSRKRTFEMFEDFDNNYNQNHNQYRYQQPPNKRPRVDNDSNNDNSVNWHHGNQCNDNHFNNNNNVTNNNITNNKENFFRFGFQ